jgi:hypothetical protein
MPGITLIRGEGRSVKHGWAIPNIEDKNTREDDRPDNDFQFSRCFGCRFTFKARCKPVIITEGCKRR